MNINNDQSHFIHQSIQYLIGLGLAVLFSNNLSFSQEWLSYPYKVDKKIIEFGWDLPAARFVNKNIRSMEERPFNGLIFSSGNKIPLIFNPVDYSKSTDMIDLKSLKSIQWKKFTDNFLILWSGDENGMSYFDDSQWKIITHNMRLLAKAARDSHCKGIDFDTEFYSKKSPWAFKDHSEGRSQLEVQQNVRQRGREVMEALQSEFPDIIILCQYIFSYVPDRWDLLPCFMNGMLEAAEPTVMLIEGDEESYYWGTTNKWFDRYNEQRIEMRNKWCDKAFYSKFNKQVQIAKSLYDAEIRKDKHSPADKARRWEHNVYMGLMTTDEYVWGYFERKNWWGNDSADMPVGHKIRALPQAFFEEGIRKARRKYDERSPLGWDMAGQVWSEGTIDISLSVRIISPGQDAIFRKGVPIKIVADVRDARVNQLDFYININKIGEVNQPPYSFELDSLPPGTYELVARAKRDSISNATSAPVRISVHGNKK